MTVPTNTWVRDSAIGVREDLSDIIYDISPQDTPFFSNIGKTKATNTLHEWQTDYLATASVNARVEGDDVASDAAIATVRLGNYTQISTKVAQVSTTLRATDNAGRQDELSYQVSKNLKAIKRDIETALTGNQAATAGAAASARVLCGVGPWLWNNAVPTATDHSTTVLGARTVPIDDVHTTSSVSAINETRLKSAIIGIWTDGGNPTVIMAPAAQKVAISGFSGIATRFKDVPGNEPAAIIGAADVYVSDFGTHYVVANRYMPTGSVYVLDMEYWKIAWLQPIKQEPLSKTGLSDRVMISCEYTLEASNPAASGKVYGMTS